LPDAGSRPSFARMEHATDVSELAPPASEPVPSTTSDPSVRIAPPRVAMADTGNPASAQPPISEEPISSTEDGVAIFRRDQLVPRELADLRARRKPR
jgi:hypothetical protein